MPKPLSDCAKRSVEIHAQYEAKKRGSDRVEPIDILLGITREEGGTSAQAIFAEQGTSLSEVRKAAKLEIVRYGKATFTGRLPLSGDTDDLLVMAARESGKRIHTVGLLLGILGLDESDAARKVLRRFGIRTVHTRITMSKHHIHTEKIRI